MYLTSITVENDGPLRMAALEMPFHEDGRPKPVMLVGPNGSGKTTFLSIIADALHEAAADAQLRVLAYQGTGRRYFRFVQPAGGAVALLRFSHDSHSPMFALASGSTAKTRLAELAKSSDGFGFVQDKHFAPGGATIRDVFENGVYHMFPASRNEVPSWFNIDAITEVHYPINERLSDELSWPIYIEQPAARVEQWLAAVIADSRLDTDVLGGVFGQLSDTSSEAYRIAAQAHLHRRPLDAFNIALRHILHEPTARIAWGNRHQRAVQIISGEKLAIRVKDLSSGQITLLGMFGALLAHIDDVQRNSTFDHQNAVGICLIDEIDAHMHVDLQVNALPKLMAMFPRVQFILSCHSPFVGLGMEQTFSPEGFVVFEMPSGRPVPVEAYSEFQRAFELFQMTKAFAAELQAAVVEHGRPLVYCEGPTDPIYLTKAAEMSGRSGLLARVEIRFAGKHDAKGQIVGSGKDNMKHLGHVAKMQPELVNRRFLLLYDPDARRPDEDEAKFTVRSWPRNPENTEVQDGIENLVPQTEITSQFRKITKKAESNGKRVTIDEIDKMALATHLCGPDARPEVFIKFEKVLDIIEAFVDHVAPVNVSPMPST